MNLLKNISIQVLIFSVNLVDQALPDNAMAQIYVVDLLAAYLVLVKLLNVGKKNHLTMERSLVYLMGPHVKVMVNVLQTLFAVHKVRWNSLEKFKHVKLCNKISNIFF